MYIYIYIYIYTRIQNQRRNISRKREIMDVWLRSYGGSNLFLLLMLMIFCFCNSVAYASFNVTTIRFNEGYSPLFGDGNLVRSPDGKSVRLLLDRFTGIDWFIYFEISLFMRGYVFEFPRFDCSFFFFFCSDFLIDFSGSGFISSKMYNHGFFSARIKLPSDYTAGIVVAFYVSSDGWSFV